MGSICEPASSLELARAGLFDAILANPPFVPNPDNVSTACGPLYSRGGPDGQVVLKAVIERSAEHLLAPGGRLSIVATVPNAEGLATRIESWIDAAGGEKALADPKSAYRGVAFCSEPTSAADFLADAFDGRPRLEHQRYVAGLRRSGVQTMSDMLLLLWRRPTGPRCSGACHEPQKRRSVTMRVHNGLWADEQFLRSDPQHALGEFILESEAAGPCNEAMHFLDSLD